VKVGFDFIWREHGLKPREADFVILDGEAEVTDVECLFDEASFGFEKVCQVSDVCAVERKGNGKASTFVGFFLRSIVFTGGFQQELRLFFGSLGVNPSAIRLCIRRSSLSASSQLTHPSLLTVMSPIS
jgi:hypothetical protein